MTTLAISAILLASAIPTLAAEPVDDPVDAALGQLDSIVEEAMTTTAVPAVVHGDETVFTRGYGVRNISGAEPVSWSSSRRARSRRTGYPSGASALAASTVRPPICRRPIRR